MRSSVRLSNDCGTSHRINLCLLLNSNYVKDGVEISAYKRILCPARVENLLCVKKNNSAIVKCSKNLQNQCSDVTNCSKKIELIGYYI